VLFNTGCNEQAFLLNPEREFGADPSCRFQEKRKKIHSLIPKYNATELKARQIS